MKRKTRHPIDTSRKMTRFFPVVLTLFFICFLFTQNRIIAQDTTQKIVQGRINDAVQSAKPYVFLISIDGFRYDFAKRYNAQNLLKLASKGVAADGMKPSYPSLTFPNHYTLATGLYPAHHGLVDNFFYDRNKKKAYNKNYRNDVQDSSWYGGRPLWVLAEQQKMLSAVFYWVGSEAAIMGVKPTYTYNFTTYIPLAKRIEIVKSWFKEPDETRPHLVMFYFYEVDDAAHHHGPESKEVEDAVHRVDSAIGALAKVADETGLPVNFIVLSDHGMIKVDPNKTLPLPEEVASSRFLVPQGDALLQIYATNKNDIQPTYKALRNNANGFKVYLKNELPHRWKYGSADDKYNRVGDIILIPELPRSFLHIKKTKELGKHGFDPALPEMMASFYAWGPAIKTGEKVKPFDNVNVYPIIAKILGLRVDDKIDGKEAVLNNILR